MHILGIVGGIGPESTIDYYRSILRQHRAIRTDTRVPTILINSIDVDKLMGMAAADDLGGLTRYLLKAVTRLADAGAGIALFAANTPHLVFDRVARKSPIPLISIVETTCDEVKRLDLEKPALLGTRFTMNGTFYPEVLARQRLPLVIPTPEEQEIVHAIYVGELLQGIVRDESRETLVKIIDAMAARDGIDSVILGGTELSLILKEPLYGDVVTLDTTQIHVRAAVTRMMQ